MISEWIEFGQVSAERDDNLSEYFYENGVLESVIKNRHHFLVLGRKGAGKTAVFQHFENNPERYIGKNDLSISMSLQNYSWDVHSLLMTEGKASSMAYIQSWKYVIYLLSVRKLIESGVSNKKIDLIKKILERIYTSPVPSISEIIGQKLLQLSKIKLPGAGLSLDDGELENLSADVGEISFSDVKSDNSLKVVLNNSLERLTDILEGVLLESFDESRRIFITFDRIDEAWDEASFESSQKIIAGLIGAADSIVSKFRGSVRPVVFLREDIFETLSINDMNKLRSDCGQLLAWSKDGISRMILERVNFYADRSGNERFSKIEELFDREQMRQQRSPFDYILLRTMLRPRDFIRIFQLVKLDMEDRRNNPFEHEDVNEQKLECQSIYNSEPAYSEWLVDEIKDEWKVQSPQINQFLTEIQNNGATNFTASDLMSSLNKIDMEYSLSEIGANLKFLYDNSIIGFRVGKSQQWKFKCFFKSQGFLEADLYKVHDGLHRGLNLTESRSSA
ncbi:P-loop ATPase, Sll1717 family [Thalassobaculum sp. OXR-137]|uniref:P-loop ATPase, Sll1717 family n=1 Tax=Thalassobaculum sp. OXR-137 TaxID=3100173 RepID=UPI0039FBC97F